MMRPPENPLISVIIPTHNCADYIADTIESVLAQTYGEYEIIVVDDGSTDDTKSALAPYMGKIHYLHQNNRGVAAARNAGIARARGEYIAFLDADDIWFPTKLALQVHALEANPAVGLAFADFLDFDDTGVTRSSRLNTWPQAKAWFTRHQLGNSEIACGPMYEELLQACWIHASSAVVKRHVLGVVGLFGEAFLTGEDYELWLRVAQRYPFLWVNRVLSGYRYRAQSICGPGDGRPIQYHCIFVRALEHHLQNHLVPREFEDPVKKVLSQRYWALGWNCFGENRLVDARSLFWRGIRYYPYDRLLWLYWCSSFLPLPVVEAIRRLKRCSSAFQGRTETITQ